jgi:hypothetical protein
MSLHLLQIIPATSPAHLVDISVSRPLIFAFAGSNYMDYVVDNYYNGEYHYHCDLNSPNLIPTNPSSTPDLI